MPTTTDLELLSEQVAQLRDRQAIGELITRLGVMLDQKNWRAIAPARART
jgi:hypothetical protein